MKIKHIMLKPPPPSVFFLLTSSAKKKRKKKKKTKTHKTSEDVKLLQQGMHCFYHQHTPYRHHKETQEEGPYQGLGAGRHHGGQLV